ncbi:hypothetical protein [Streptococcus merionis]|uniref:hypothetical protein n=1 Tax=Streptococcus merionis TaxID=400065 RepID=UPI0026F232D3|nr:hypothetical protein [Streptococcus merionis]
MKEIEKQKFWLYFMRDTLLYITLSLVVNALISFFIRETSVLELRGLGPGFGALVGGYMIRMIERYGAVKGCLTSFVMFFVSITLGVFLGPFQLPWAYFPLVFLLAILATFVFHCYFIRGSFRFSKSDLGLKKGQHQRD